MTAEIIPADYPAWPTELKTRRHQAQQRATLSVNRERIALSGQLGQDMLTRQAEQGWGDPAIVQQAVGQLPWGPNLVLLTRLKAPEWRLAYPRQAIEHGWSRKVLKPHRSQGTGMGSESEPKETPGPLNRKRSRKGSRGQRPQFVDSAPVRQALPPGANWIAAA